MALQLPLAEWAAGLVTWIQAAGATGTAVFAMAYLLATLGMLPGSVLTLGAGFVYGPVGGTLLVSPVSVLAATCAFLLGRTAARGWVAHRLTAFPRFEAVDRAVEGAGFRIVLLLRLSPLFPFTVLNYALGLTRVRLRDYVAASWLGMLPGTILYVYLGSLVTSASDLARGGAGTATSWTYWLGLGASLAVAIVVTRTARTALSQSLSAHAASLESR
ncbi:MAG: TVP38/TMEM64 family protein [Vicinamibacterales bacterium]